MPNEKAGVPEENVVKERGSNGPNPGPESNPSPRATDVKVDSAEQMKAQPNGATKTDQKGAADLPVKRRFNTRKIVPLLVLLVAAGLLLAITVNWNRLVGGRGTQKTDDAYLRSDITPLSTRVSGTVQQVAVADYQRVKAGDLLVQLKDDDFKAQVAQAEAGVAAAQAALENNARQKELQASRIKQAQAVVEAASAQTRQTGAAIEAALSDVVDGDAAVDAVQAKIPDAQAAVAAAQADAERTLLERRRQEALLEMGSATKQKLEQVVADQERFAAIVDS